MAFRTGAGAVECMARSIAVDIGPVKTERYVTGMQGAVILHMGMTIIAFKAMDTKGDIVGVGGAGVAVRGTGREAKQGFTAGGRLVDIADTGVMTDQETGVVIWMTAGAGTGLA